MSNYKIFDILQAEKQLTVYKEKQNYAKEMLLTELIKWQYFFGNRTIVGVKVSTGTCYARKTVVEVLNDLGYMLTSYKTDTLKPYKFGTSEKFIEFTFIPKNSSNS